MANLTKKQLHILITRPEQEAARTSEKLEALGHQVSSVPLFQVVFRELDDICLNNITAVIFTSTNAVRALTHWLETIAPPQTAGALQSKNCFVVGEYTAETVFPLDFYSTYSTGADAAALVKLIENTTNPTKDHLLHIRGAEISTDIAKHFKALGYACSEKIVYHMQPRPEAASELQDILSTTNKPIDVITFFSAKTAEQFVNLIGANKLEPQLENVKALCLSEKISAEIRSLPFRDITVSAKPNINALIETLVE